MKLFLRMAVMSMLLLSAIPSFAQSLTEATQNGNNTFTGTNNLSGQNTITAFNINNVIRIDGQKYLCTVGGFNAAVAALPATGGTVDGRFCTGSISLGNGTITVGNAALQQPVRLLLGSGNYTFANTAGAHGFVIPYSGSKIIGPGPINLIINCTGTGMGDFVHAEATTGNSINAIEVTGFRIDATNCPSSIHVNALSVRDPSWFHDLDLRNWLGTVININASTNAGALLSQGISVRDVYAQSATGTITANSMVLTGNELEIGNNVKIIVTGTIGAFVPIIIQPSVTPSGDGRRSHVFGTSVSCNNGASSTGLLVTAPAGATTGAQANMVGPEFAAENCTLGIKLTGADASHNATNNWVGFNAYTPSTSNVITLDFANANWVEEFTNGNAADITLTTNATNNNILARLAGASTDISDASASNANLIWTSTLQASRTRTAVNALFAAGRYMVAGPSPGCSVTGAGVGATCNTENDSTDSSGTMVIAAAGTPTSSGTVTLTFSDGFGSSADSPACILQLDNTTTSWSATAIAPIISSRSVNNCIWNWNNNGTALVAASSYRLTYLVIGKGPR